MNPVIEMLDRRLRLAVIGGGRGSFIDAIRRRSPEGLHEGFATIYSDAAEAIAARRAGVPIDPDALHFPNARDGVLGVAFVEAALTSSAAEGAWTPCAPDIDG